MARKRLDSELVSRGIAKDLEQAKALIEEKRVLVSGAPAMKPASMVASAAELVVLPESKRYVSRGGQKLAGAIENFGILCRGRNCLDIGAGSGGFTDCLLQAGATKVAAVDVGYGQFDFKLRTDPRVELVERTNFRTMPTGRLKAGSFDLIVADLSFISLTVMFNQMNELASSDADLVLLVKPQFEAPRKDVPAGGVVGDPEVWVAAMTKVARSAQQHGWALSGATASFPLGTQGNQEFFLWLRRGRNQPIEGLIAQAIASVS